MKRAILAAGILTAAHLWAASSTGCPAIAAVSPTATIWDNSGNYLLSGSTQATYFFRYVQYTVGDPYGDLSRAVTLYQTITFNANGTYMINGLRMDSNASPASPAMFTKPGTYSISANGFGYLTNPLFPTDQIWGMVSKNGVFVGSTTETQNHYNDLFIASPQGPAAATNSTLAGAYSVAYMNFPNGYVTSLVTAGFQMNPNGQGSIGTVNILANQGANPAVGISESVNYSFSNGIGSLSFPGGYGLAISGQEALYITPDGSFVFGGSPTGYDVFVGVQTSSSTSNTNPVGFNPQPGAFNFAGVYSQAGIDETMSIKGPTVYGAIQTYYGAFEAVSGIIFDHQRILSPNYSVPQAVGSASQAFGYTYTDTYSLAFGSNGGYTDTVSQRQYVIGADGAIRIGFGLSPNLGISVALQAPTPVPTCTPSVYINPEGVLNAASYAPFTSGISPGELIVIYGSNFATSGMVAAAPYPNTLGNVQVMINNEAAGIQYVYPDQIGVIVPSDIAPLSYAQIQVNSNGTYSNAVWELVNTTTPGVLTQFENGLGDSLALHASGNSLVTPSNPAAAAEVLSVFMTGLGKLIPVAGLLPSSNGTGQYDPANAITATIGGVSAALSYPNLSPAIAGLDLVSVTVPSGVTGEAVLVIYGPDSQAAQATICVISCPALSPTAAAVKVSDIFRLSGKSPR